MPTTTSTPSWPAKRLLPFLPAFLALFASCEEPTDIGLDIQPNSQIGVLYTDTITVESGTVLLDSIVTTGSNAQVTNLVGHIQDPVLGTVTAKLYTELRLREPGDIGANATVDSVKMSLKYLSGYGITGEKLTLNVHRLATNEQIHKDTTYYNFDTLNYEPAVLGSAEVKPKDLNPTSSNPALISIEFNEQAGKAFGQYILDLPASSRANQDAFRAAVNGIAIVPETAVGRSIISLGFENDTDNSFLEIFYTDAGEKKTYKLFIDRSTRRFHSIKANRTGTVVAGLDNSANNGFIAPVAALPGFEEETFIQAGIGLRTVVKFPHLDSLRHALGTEIAINKADLIMPVVGGSTSLFAPPPFLAMAEAAGNSIHPKITSPSLIGTDAAPGGIQSVSYSSNLNQYSAQMGTYLQSVLYGRRQNRGIIIYSTSNAVQVNRVRLKEPGPTGMRLRIYYTKVG